MDTKETAKTVQESLVETYHIVQPGDLNDANRLYGGVLMSWIDEVAALVGRRHGRMKVTTGAVENLRFLHGAYVRDIVYINGRVTYVGNTSMEVRVDSYVEHITGERELINRAYLTLVGLDGENRPCRLPRLILETESDRMEWERAEIRRNMRIQQRKEGFHFYGDEE